MCVKAWKIWSFEDPGHEYTQLCSMQRFQENLCHTGVPIFRRGYEMRKEIAGHNSGQKLKHNSIVNHVDWRSV
jgi:hypothetical protein